MSDDMAPSDHLYYGLEALPGWSETLGRAQAFSDATRWRVGSLISSILLAAGEEREAVAVGGELDAEGTGYAFIMYEDLAVLVEADKLNGDQADFVVSTRSLNDITDLRIRTRHNYFDGTDEHPRGSGARLEFSVAGKTITIPTPRSYGHSALVKDSAAVAAFTLPP